jgi:hypothetical protein
MSKMDIAGMALRIDGPHSFPVRLLAKAIDDQLIDFGLSCIDHDVADSVVPSDLSLTARATDNVVIFGRLVWVDKIDAPTLVTLK